MKMKVVKKAVFMALAVGAMGFGSVAMAVADKNGLKVGDQIGLPASPVQYERSFGFFENGDGGQHRLVKLRDQVVLVSSDGYGKTLARDVTDGTVGSPRALTQLEEEYIINRLMDPPGLVADRAGVLTIVRGKEGMEYDLINFGGHSKLLMRNKSGALGVIDVDGASVRSVRGLTNADFEEVIRAWGAYTDMRDAGGISLDSWRANGVDLSNINLNSQEYKAVLADHERRIEGLEAAVKQK